MAAAGAAPDDARSRPFAGDAAAAGEAAATGIEDLPADVLALVLRRLDGPSLAALGCASTAFRALAADSSAWRSLCLALWPSLLAALPLDAAAKDHYYRRLFADAFPLPALPSPPPATPTPTGLPARLVSAVDLRHRGALVLSRAVDTDAASRWFLSAPFRVDALAAHEAPLALTLPAPVAPAELELSWVVLDQSTGRAVRASTRRPVRVDRRWPTGDTVARFGVVLGDAAVLDAAVTCDERSGRVSEVRLCVEDAEGGGGVSGRDGLALVAAAMAGGRVRRGGGDEAEAGARARKRYEEFVEARAERKERRARREGVVDLCCSGVGAAAFLGFLLMLTFR